jgi:threonylcarbamoyladenosine tRNA methylthiotransferase MtaB
MSDDHGSTPRDSRRVAFCTFGCRLNQYDTESLRALLAASGRFRSVGTAEEADVYVVNTGSVTNRADASARKAVRRLHAEHPEAEIVVTGCYAQRAPRELADLDGVTLVIGAADRGRIVDELARTEIGRARIAVSPVEDAKTFLEVPITEMTERSRAFVKIQEGCNESCTFCIVPQTRGRSRSRVPERVLAQVEALVEAGHVEIVLTGVHVGDYGVDLPGAQRLLAPLIRRVLEVPGLARLRLSSIEPASVTDEIIELVASEGKFARHFHIPFQSGNDEILARMRRRYTAGEFRELVTRIAVRIPGCGIGSDVICGFPGEDERHFRDTFDCLVELPITYIHPFTYSPRPGSEAERFADQVSADGKKRRTRALKRLSADKARAARESHLGTVVEVLPELGTRPAGGTETGFDGSRWRAEGWTDNYLKVEVTSDAPLSNRLVRVRVTGSGEGALRGDAVSE